MGPPARSNPTALWSRNYLEFFKILMTLSTTLSMGLCIVQNFQPKCCKNTASGTTPYGKCFSFLPPVSGRPRQTSQGILTESSTVFHRDCVRFRPYVHENFENVKIISTSSLIRSRRRPHQLPVGVEIILNFSKFSWTIGTERSALSMGHSRG